jgi:hypothetical protein
MLLVGALIAFGLFGVFKWGSYAIDSGTPGQRAGALAVVAVLGVGALLAFIYTFSS